MRVTVWNEFRHERANPAVAAIYPDARTSTDLEELLADPELDAVVVATPVPTHAALATRVLRGVDG